MSGTLGLWPALASDYAGKVDVLMWAFCALIVALTAPVFVLMAWFMVKYRRGKAADRSAAPSNSVALETAWAVIPFLLILGFFVYAGWLFFQLQRPPPGALVIDVVAKQWMWKFQHPGGQAEIDDLHVPAGEPVRLNMTSQDVIHSLYLPALRIKQDVLPGRYTSLWFIADRVGVYRVHCTQFCGADHSLMGGALYVMAPSDYARWLQTAQGGSTLAAQGADLFRSVGCSGCHQGASAVRAPSLQGLYGRRVALADGRTVAADEQYLRDSILLPNRDVAAGYQPLMPTFAGALSEGQVQALVAYLRSLGSAGEEPGHGA